MNSSEEALYKIFSYWVLYITIHGETSHCFKGMRLNVGCLLPNSVSSISSTVLNLNATILYKASPNFFFHLIFILYDFC